MAMGTRKGRERQEEIWYSSEVAEAPGHPFYRKLEATLKEASFDSFCEDLRLPPGLTQTVKTLLAVR